MEWLIAAPFLRDAADRWLTRFVPNDDAALRFRTIPAPYVHDGSRKVTGLGAWRDYVGHAGTVWREVQRSAEPVGVVTSFPQLAISIGARKRLAGGRTPLIAWTFNLGHLHRGARRHLARAALGAVDRFIVHSSAETVAYSEWLDLPASRFRFVPLQSPARPIELGEDLERPFIVSMGSAQRDYRLLFAVLGELKYHTVVVAAPHAVAGLAVPGNIEVRSGLTPAQCFELVQRARMSVIPVANRLTASGQVTLLDAMMFARPVVMTACLANADYATHDHDAMLVRHGDHDDLKATIQQLWEDDALRARLAAAAHRTATERFSDGAIGRVMGAVLREASSPR